MQVIYKYPLEITNIQQIIIPGYVKTLTVQVQNDVPCLWILIDNDAATAILTIETIGTGDYFSASEYIGTYQLGALVFHVFQSRG